MSHCCHRCRQAASWQGPTRWPVPASTTPSTAAAAEAAERRHPRSSSCRQGAGPRPAAAAGPCWAGTHVAQGAALGREGPVAARAAGPARAAAAAVQLPSSPAGRHGVGAGAQQGGRHARD
jgi:hypothetical protein